LGKEIQEVRQFSEETAHIIDQEVQRFVNDAAARALQILDSHRGPLKALADALLTNEELSKEQVAEILGPRPERESTGPLTTLSA
jgi:cell division protease FtsH